jgi:hypothetical protein
MAAVFNKAGIFGKQKLFIRFFLLVMQLFYNRIFKCRDRGLCGAAAERGPAQRGLWFTYSMARLPLIATWALLSSTVGLILRLMEDRSETLGQIVAGLLGLTWSIASYMVIPILVIDRQYPINALNFPAALLKKNWGEQLYCWLGYGAITLAVSIPAFFAIAFGLIILIISGNAKPIIIAICLSIIYLFVSVLIISALETVFQAALYLYARDGQAPVGFQADLLQKAMSRG